MFYVAVGGATTAGEKEAHQDMKLLTPDITSIVILRETGKHRTSIVNEGPRRKNRDNPRD
jgi:type 1 glutamine amidotransferase